MYIGTCIYAYVQWHIYIYIFMYAYTSEGSSRNKVHRRLRAPGHELEATSGPLALPKRGWQLRLAPGPGLSFLVL